MRQRSLPSPRSGRSAIARRRPTVANLIARCSLVLLAVLVKVAAQHSAQRRAGEPLRVAALYSDNYHKHFGEIEQQWKYDPMLVCRSASVYGLVEKRYMGSHNPTHNMDTEMADKFSFDKIPIYAPTKYFVSRMHKFIFVRQPKSSSSAIIDAITKTFCASSKCTEYELTPMTTVADSLWRVYFVFTWIRNPFTRVVSAYKMMTSKYMFERGGADGHTVGERCSVPFLEFSEDSNRLRSVCQQRGCCSYVPEYKQWIPWFIAAHINDQSHAVFTYSNASMVDFIGRTEHIEEDWAAMLKHMNRRHRTRFRPMSFDIVNGEAADAAAAAAAEPCPGYTKLTSFLNETTMGNIARQYSRDLNAFGFLREEEASTAAS